MMQRDEFINTLRSTSVLVMLGIKALTVIIFVFVVLSAGLNHLNLIPLVGPVTTPVIETAPVPDVALGNQVMVIPTPMPATQTPTQAVSTTQAPTNTELPTETATSTNAPTSQPTATITTQPLFTETNTPAPTVMSTATLSPSLTPTTMAVTSTPVANSMSSLVASPLLGIAPSELAEIVTQSFKLPPTGEDSGHHGVDFAFWKRGDLASIEGLPILSIFPGKVISAYSKIRTPYGYMVIVETPLSSLPVEVLDLIKLPEVSSTPASPSNRLTCPVGFADWWSTDSQSLYVLYGHLKEIPSVNLGQTVKIGDLLGYVGNTGSSTNPHLHLEMRIGPSNAVFSSMGHYDTTTSEQERHNYCMWRISGEFQMFDPMELYGASGD